MSIIGGALQGLGMGIMDAAKQKREEALEKLRNDRALEQYRAKRNIDEEFDLKREQRREDKISDAAAAFSGKFNANRASYIRNKFVSLGYPEHVANGLVGNIMQESGTGINTGAVGDGGYSIGMGQWNKKRGQALKAYAKERGTDWKDLDTQILYLDHELKTTEKAAYNAVLKTKTASEAAKVLSNKFWRPGKPHLQNRIEYANRMARIALDPDQTPQARSMAQSELNKMDVGNSGGKRKNLSASATKHIRTWAEDQGMDEEQANAFITETERLYGGGKMTENQAWQEVLKYAQTGTEEKQVGGGFLNTVTMGALGQDPGTQTIDTGYTGEFNYPQGHPGYTAQPAMSSSTPQGFGGVAPTTPAVPPSQPMAQPKPSGGIAQPTSKAEYDALPSGSQYKDPNGVTRIKP